VRTNLVGPSLPQRARNTLVNRPVCHVGHTDVPCELCLHKLALGVEEKATKRTTAPFLPPLCNRQSDSGAEGAQIFPA